MVSSQSTELHRHASQQWLPIILKVQRSFFTKIKVQQDKNIMMSSIYSAVEWWIQTGLWLLIYWTIKIFHLYTKKDEMVRCIWEPAVCSTWLITMAFMFCTPPLELKGHNRAKMLSETKIMYFCFCFFFLQNAANKGLDVKIKSFKGPKRHSKGSKGSSFKRKSFEVLKVCWDVSTKR